MKELQIGVHIIRETHNLIYYCNKTYNTLVIFVSKAVYGMETLISLASTKYIRAPLSRNQTAYTTPMHSTTPTS